VRAESGTGTLIEPDFHIPVSLLEGSVRTRKVISCEAVRCVSSESLVERWGAIDRRMMAAVEDRLRTAPAPAAAGAFPSRVDERGAGREEPVFGRMMSTAETWSWAVRAVQSASTGVTGGT